MHYELYVDSLFLINFIMNLYLLKLVDYTAFRRASPSRILAGAAFGALCFLLPFAGWGPAAVKLAAGAAAGTAGMLCIAFRVRSLRMLLKLAERMLLYSFGMGGAMLFLIQRLPGGRKVLTCAFGILGVGMLCLLFFGRFRPGLNQGNSLGRAVLSKGGRQVTANVLIDSGNSLTEPVSGKPVCIVDRKIFHELWEEDTGIFRAIPYHSIGKRRGILRGYLLPKLELERDGMEFVFDDVYIAVSDEDISGAAEAESVNMIINPGIFEKDKSGSRRKRQNVRYNDSESNDTGQDTI